MAIYAWRCWTYWDSMSHPYLFPDITVWPMLRGVRGIAWPVSEPLTAVCGRCECAICINHNSNCHTPDPDCQCGIYALKQPYNLTYFSINNVIGIVELWGKVIEAEFGYRAQIGRIRAVVNALETVSTTYGIPNFPSIEYAQREFFSVQERRAV